MDGRLVGHFLGRCIDGRGADRVGVGLVVDRVEQRFDRPDDDLGCRGHQVGGVAAVVQASALADGLYAAPPGHRDRRCSCRVAVCRGTSRSWSASRISRIQAHSVRVTARAVSNMPRR